MTDFGRHRLSEWPLDPGIVYLNHGTVGVAPLAALEAQHALRIEIERSPSRFMLRELTGTGYLPDGPRSRLREAMGVVAPFLGARPEDMVFVDNVTTGINAVLRSFPFSRGDEILITKHVYGAVGNVARYVASVHGAIVREVELPHPLRRPQDASLAIDAAITPNTRIAIVDHITSESALLFPIHDIVARCHAKNVPVLVDGAHAPGAIELDIPSIGADWYSANLHKWCWTPRGCGILWVAPVRQATVKPAVISWGYEGGFTTEFDWAATKDPTPMLVAPVGIALMRDAGLEALRAHNHAIAWSGARALCEAWGTEFAVPESMVGAMVTVPLPENMGSTRVDADRLRAALLFEDRIEVQLHAWKGNLWVRICGQVYNDMRDIERLAKVVNARRGRVASG